MIRRMLDARIRSDTTTNTIFDDDEPLPPPPPPPLQTTPPPHQPSSPAATATLSTFTEFPAVAASDSPSEFAVLVKARAPPLATGSRHRTPIDLVAVLDVSGSMEGHKIILLKRAVCFIIDTLGPSDRLSIVTFSSHARRTLKLCCMSDPGHRRAYRAVNSLNAGGSTNIKSGLITAVRVLEQRRHRNAVAGLILLSDGEDTDNPRLDRQQYSHLLPSHIVPIHTFGFGSDHDSRAMHAIADASGGTYSFIEKEECIQDAFAMCIGGLLSVVAQQVELMVSAASDGIRIASVSSGSYRSRVLRHGLEAVINVGDLYAEEDKDFLVHISIPQGKGPQEEMPLVVVKCSYKDPQTQEAIHVDGETAVIRRPESLTAEDRAVSLIVDGQRNRILVAESMREAQRRADMGDLEGAKAVLRSGMSALAVSAAAQAGDVVSGWLEAELQEIQRRMADMHVYEISGRAYAFSGMSSHSRQRAAGGALAMQEEAFEVERGNDDGDEEEDAMDDATGKAPRLHLEGLDRQRERGASPGREKRRRRRRRHVGYQTGPMRDMVERSREHSRT